MNNNNVKRTPSWVIVLIVIGAIGFLGVVGAIFGEDSELSENNSDKSSTTQTTKTEKLVLEDGHTGYADDYGISYYIEGYIKNNTDKEYSYVQVTFNVYDAENNNLGTCMANNTGLEGNGRWKFKAICSGEAKNIASYKLSKITKW